MRRLLPFLAAMSVLACDTGVSGTYDLVSLNGEELPFSVGTFTLTSGSLALTSDSTFAVTLTGYFGDGDPETENDSGTFTLDVSNVIHFTPGPESDNVTPYEGTLDGDQIQITASLDDDYTFVFRRRLPPSRY